MCGDIISDDELMPRSSSVEDSDRPFTTKSWSIPRPWSQAGASSSLGPFSGIRSKRGHVLSPNQPYQTFLKKSIPFVSLCLDQSCRNIIVDSIINNVYIKIPDSSVSALGIISTMATKIGCEPNDLILLDVKFIEIADDKGECAVIQRSYAN